MTRTQQAKKDWDQNTSVHRIGPRVSNSQGTHQNLDYQQFGQAIALVYWPEDYINLAKLEKLPGAGRGAAVPLIDFLKSLADKYRLCIQAHVRPYTPAPPWSERKPTLEELKGWYQRRGFRLFPGGDPEFPWAWYPDAPKDWLAVASELVALE
ncbi:MAG TPA: hypothetical protein VH280_07395 [Verrucomicrobiae bacterium]|nr:hypothetical protein [Verrucomicrobiae bacterium]